jgi:DNA-binding XRE family transcriptional regulator
MPKGWLYETKAEQIGLAIRVLRYAHRINGRSVFTDTIGITKQHLHKIERGAARPKHHLVLSICTFFGITFEEFRALADGLANIEPKAMLVLELERELKYLKSDRPRRRSTSKLRKIVKEVKT